MSYDHYVAPAAPEKSGRVVGEPEVMNSAAGYYVGCYVTEDGFSSPHSRFSDYFGKSQEAQTWLDDAKRTNSL